MTHWAYSFYDFQDGLTGCYAAPVHPSHRERAAEVRRDAPGLRLLELGSGGGQFAVAAALEIALTPFIRFQIESRTCPGAILRGAHGKIRF